MAYNKSDYMARWPQYLPYPYAIGRSQGPVPDASAVHWPQAQFAPPYLAPGSPSFQPYRYNDKPLRYPPGAKTLSIWPGSDHLRPSVALMKQSLRRQWMNLPEGDTTRPPSRRQLSRARRNKSLSGNPWGSGSPVFGWIEECTYKERDEGKCPNFSAQLPSDYCRANYDTALTEAIKDRDLIIASCYGCHPRQKAAHAEAAKSIFSARVAVIKAEARACATKIVAEAEGTRLEDLDAGLSEMEKEGAQQEKDRKAIEDQQTAAAETTAAAEAQALESQEGADALKRMRIYLIAGGSALALLAAFGIWRGGR